jgi:PhzF family phenazine biosynthesis protein
MLEIWQVDAFAERPLTGNPAAIVFGGEALETETMQAIARETNLSETVFVLPPRESGADYRARIFTTRREIRFAGHATLAAAHAVIERTGGAAAGSRIRQECGLGVVPVDVERRPAGTVLFVALPNAEHRTTDVERRNVAAMLGCGLDALVGARFPVVATGVPWLLVEVASLAALGDLRPDFAAIAAATRAVEAVGVTVFSRETARPDALARLRSFAPAEGIYEDPVCGSCHGSVVAHLLARDPALAASPAGRTFVLEQGHELHRPGLVEVVVRGTDRALLLGGKSVTVMKGEIGL